MPSVSPIELVVILVVALLVIGPERLPATIRTVSLWFGRFRRSFYKVKAEIERELNADEVRRQLHNESVLADLRDAKSDVENVATDARKSVNEIVNSKDFDPGASPATEEQVRAAEEERKAAATGATEATDDSTGTTHTSPEPPVPGESSTAPAEATSTSPELSALDESTTKPVGATHASPESSNSDK